MNRGNYKNILECFQPDITPPESSLYQEQQQPKALVIHKARSDLPNTRNPHVWGPGLWLFLHISSANYDPVSQEQIHRCMAFIKNLPYMLPCYNCSEHAKQFVKDREADLHTICQNRKSLFEFYVDFHNYVNNRQNKRLFSYQEAWNMYANGAGILNFSF